MQTWLQGLLSAVAVGCLALSGMAEEPNSLPTDPIDRALELSKRTGRPILAMVGSKTCPPCMALKERLSTDRSLQPLIAKYVPLYVAGDDPQAYTKWVRAGYQTADQGIPKLFVVRADGEKIYAETGAPQGRELNLILIGGLKQAGVQLSERQLVQLQESVEKAKAAVEQKDYVEALRVLAQAPGAGSYAQPAVEANALAAKLTDEAKAMLEAAQQKIDSGESKLEGVIELVQVQADFGKLPEIRTLTGQAVSELKRDADTREFVTQAQLFLRAADYVQKDRGELAVTTYKKIVEAYPDSEASKLAEQKLAASQ